MPHVDTEHGLRVQLATALRERDEARALAEKWAMREAASVERGIRSDADALSEVQGLQARVERLRGDLVKYGSHVDECNGGDFCSCGLEVARLQAARAVNAEAECAHLATLRAKQDAELVSTREALAAARREIAELRDDLGASHSRGAHLHCSKDSCDVAADALEALATPAAAAGEDSK